MVGNANEEPRTGDGEAVGGSATVEMATAPVDPAGAAAGIDRARLDADASFRPPSNGNGEGPLPVRPAGSWATTVLPTESAPPGTVIAPESAPVVELPPADPLAVPVEAPRRFWAPDAVPPPVAATTPPFNPPTVTPAALPMVPTAPPVVTPPVVLAAPVAAPPPTTTAKPPTGALVLLPGEEVLMQLGALYLTTRRAILYAPTILRATFLRDVDAVGTVTERSGGWMFLIGLISLGAGAAAAYVGLTQPGIAWQLGEFFQASPLLIAIPLIVLGLFTLASYFFWVKRSLFLSVGGRPLIVVSVTGWSAKKLEPVDQFVNAFSAAKDR
ncbi:MAG: hypothetical protein M3Z04_21750, partial [Chloroflexota bacterium]|nr:hypothetical protein [Chloroflexota bacterium]